MKKFRNVTNADFKEIDLGKIKSENWHLQSIIVRESIYIRQFNGAAQQFIKFGTSYLYKCIYHTNN
jgi:hypothetical protein